MDVIEWQLNFVQFWSEIILVISDETRAARSFDFEITRMISDQIALHSVQLPLFIEVRSVQLLLHIFIKKKNKQRQNNPVSSLDKLISLTCNPDNCNVSCDSVIEIKKKRTSLVFFKLYV